MRPIDDCECEPVTTRTAPYQRHSETSREAAEQITTRSNTLRAQVLRFIKQRGDATDEEIQMGLQMNPSTQRPRRIELVEMMLVKDSHRRRKTRSGRAAVVWECGPTD